jgi:hypothetical protein
MFHAASHRSPWVLPTIRFITAGLIIFSGLSIMRHPVGMPNGSRETDEMQNNVRRTQWRLTDDPRFQAVRVEVAPDDANSIHIGGWVRPGDAAELKNRIFAKAPPMNIVWEVQYADSD